jgi:hypothetical protein
MEVRTDDEVHRVDAVWLGPPNATFPWRARYVAYGLFLLYVLGTLTVFRQFMGFGFFMFAWCLLLSVLLTRWTGKLITHERPFGAVLTMLSRELHAPRRREKGTGGSTTVARPRGRRAPPRPRSRATTPTTDQRQRDVLVRPWWRKS